MAQGVRSGAGDAGVRPLRARVLLVPSAADENGQYVSYSAFVDLDRTDLFRILRVAERPILELGRAG